MFWPFKRKQSADVAYIMTGDGNITVRFGGKTHSIGKTHRNYDKIVSMLLNRTTDHLDLLLDIPASIERAVKGVTVNEYGEVFYGNEPVHGVIADKIGEFVRNKLPYKPLAAFLSNLMQNPSERSRNELYGFLMHGGFPITHDGCFMAYKGITSDWKDIYSKSFDNSIGSVNEMPRENVDPDSAVACSTGFHVGTHEYAKGFATGDSQVVLVKVNPRDAVSVPLDHDASKLRVCRYEVVEVCQAKRVEPLYIPQDMIDHPERYECTEGEDEDDPVYGADEPEECDACGSPYCDGDCEEAMDDGSSDGDDVEESTGRRRGPGGRFLPAN